MGILDKLRGGDLRSIEKADEVVKDILTEPTLFDDVFKDLYMNDSCVRMRSADVVNHLTLTGSPAMQVRGKKTAETFAVRCFLGVSRTCDNSKVSVICHPSLF